MQAVLIPFFMVQSVFAVHFGPRISFLCIYLVVSVALTVSTTFLIIYRIRHFSCSKKYLYIAEMLIQSGAIYSIINTVTASLLAAREINPFNTALIQVTTYVGAVFPLTAVSSLLCLWTEWSFSILIIKK